VGIAPPVGAPPPVTAHVPGDASIGVATSITGSGPVSGEHALGASSCVEGDMHVRVYVSTAGDAMVHEPPVGVPHVHALQPRESSMPV
jgi:hypothetical protein